MNKPTTFVAIFAMVIVLAGCAKNDSDSNTGQDVSTTGQDVPTPFGVVPQACVHQHPQGTQLENTEDGVKATHPDSTTTDHPAQPECEAQDSINISQEWFNYAGWVPPQLVAKFTGTYVVPETPTNTSNQTLFYFIGIEDRSQSSPLTILQPVLAYNYPRHPGWSLSSWNCCPHGQRHQSHFLTGIQPGDTIVATIEKLSGTSDTTPYTITGEWKGQQTSLTVDTGAEAFNWADVTLEVIKIDACDEFAVGPMTFSNLTIVGMDGSIMTPHWELSPGGGATRCNGQLTVDGSTITIQENINP